MPEPSIEINSPTSTCAGKNSYFKLSCCLWNAQMSRIKKNFRMISRLKKGHKSWNSVFHDTLDTRWKLRLWTHIHAKAKDEPISQQASDSLLQYAKASADVTIHIKAKIFRSNISSANTSQSVTCRMNWIKAADAPNADECEKQTPDWFKLVKFEFQVPREHELIKTLS